MYNKGTHDITPLTKVPVSEMVYIHSKVMVVDDLWSIVGSANINDRSMVGTRDSEIAVVMHDTAEYIYIKMLNGKYEKVGKLGFETRTRLLQEHIGILPNELEFYNDLSSDKVFHQIKDIASKNTSIYTSIFGCVPNNDVHSFAELKKYRKKLSQRKKHQNDYIDSKTINDSGNGDGNNNNNNNNNNNIESVTVGDHAINLQTVSSVSLPSSTNAQSNQHSQLSLSSVSLSSSEREVKEDKEGTSHKHTGSSAESLLRTSIKRNTLTMPDCYAEPTEPNDPYVLNQLSQVRGHIVLYPLDFLKDETADNLLPHFGEKEFLVQSHFFT
jgi:hypothetical protein